MNIIDKIYKYIFQGEITFLYVFCHMRFYSTFGINAGFFFLTDKAVFYWYRIKSLVQCL